MFSGASSTPLSDPAAQMQARKMEEVELVEEKCRRLQVREQHLESSLAKIALESEQKMNSVRRS